MANNHQNYEMMLIYTPVLADDEFKNAQKNLSQFIKDNGGSIVHENPWGLRSLAYPIQKKTTGLYHVLEFQAPGSIIQNLETTLNRDENVMRHMVTHLDKYAVAYNESRRNKPKAEPKTEEESES